jgi:ABC-type nitrate/sulfonate/bicarbonate transport system substrate-binding protein
VTDANIALIGRAGLGPVRVIGSIMEKEDDGIIGRRDAGIAQAKDVAGKRIGYTPAGTSEVFLDLFLQHTGIKPGGVTLVPLTAPAMSAAMNHGNVDAVSVWQPFRLNIGKALGANGIEFDDDNSIYKAHILLIADHATIQARGNDLKLMFVALAKAAQFAQANPAASRALVSPELGIDPAALVATWKDYKFEVGDTDTLAGDLGRIDAAVAPSDSDRPGTSAPDYAALFDFSAQTQALSTMKTR